jgi:hypothetical protein
MGQQGDLAPSRHRLHLAPDDPDEELGSDLAGFKGVVRLRAVRYNGGALLDHLARHVGVMV